MTNDISSQTDSDLTEHWWTITAPKCDTEYAHGTASEADRYVRWLNGGRETRMYSVRELDTSEILQLQLEENLDLGFDLIDELRELEDEGLLDG